MRSNYNLETTINTQLNKSQKSALWKELDSWEELELWDELDLWDELENEAAESIRGGSRLINNKHPELTRITSSNMAANT